MKTQIETALLLKVLNDRLELAKNKVATLNTFDVSQLTVWTTRVDQLNEIIKVAKDLSK